MRTAAWLSYAVVLYFCTLAGMKLSIFTPTHDPKYLGDAYDSIQAQLYTNLEWVIVPNAARNAPLPVIPAHIVADPRVRIHEFLHDGKPRVGELKRYACDKATGDVFIELDHDDMLMPHILERIVRAFKDEGAGFVFSDAANFLDDAALSPQGYDERWGWETYDVMAYGRMCRATRSFEISPKSLCEVYYAPDHVRCWSRQAYYAAGGHNAALTVADDHDLVCRTYLAKQKFVHTGGCGYLYRHHPRNTVKTHNALIQQQQNANRDTYFHRLVDEWLNRTGYKYLDLGKTPPTYQFGALRIEAASDSIGAIRAWNSVLPKIPHGKQTEFMNEVYRVLVPGGYFCALFPSTEGREAFAPCYNSWWNEHSFDYYTNREFSHKLPDNKARFQYVRKGTLATTPDRKQRKFIDGYVDLCALKGQRQPGRVYI